MTARELDAIEARANALPPGPWVIRRSPVMGRFLDCGDGIDRAARRRLAKMTGPEQLLKFAAKARVDIPKLVAEIRKLRELKE